MAIKWNDLSTLEQFEEVLASGETLSKEDLRNLQVRVSGLVSKGTLKMKDGTDIIAAANDIGGDLAKKIDKNKPLSERAEADTRGKVVFHFPPTAGFGFRGFGCTPKQWAAIVDAVKSGEIEKGVARVVEENPGLEATYQMSRTLYAARRQQAAAAKSS